MFHQIFFVLFLIHQIDGKNYYLLDNEADTDNAKYVYSLFGLGDLGKIVSKYLCLVYSGRPGLEARSRSRPSLRRPAKARSRPVPSKARSGNRALIIKPIWAILTMRF